MYESEVTRPVGSDAAWVTELVARLGTLGGGSGSGGASTGSTASTASTSSTGDGRELLGLLSELERVGAAVAAAQVRVTEQFADRREQAARVAVVAARDQGFEVWQQARDRFRGVNDTAALVGLARGLSPWQGARAVNTARTLVHQLPGTLAALRVGVLSERRAGIVVRETSHLGADDRAAVDRAVCADLEALAGFGDRGLEREVRAAVYRCDPQGALARARVAAGERCVAVRPLPDTMCRLSAVLPLAQGVAAYATLSQHADTARADGDPRGRGQVMADTLVSRVTGQAAASAVPVEVQVVISDAALLGVSDDPAQLTGYGTVPAGWARDLIRGPEPTPSTPTASSTSTSPGTTAVSDPGAEAELVEQTRVWLRRLYATPDASHLVAMDSARRCFPAGLRRFLITRDGSCRTPWCDAPIRHIDLPYWLAALTSGGPVREHGSGGPTSEHNGQGLCQRCNHTKQQPGWSVGVLDPPAGQPAQPHRVRWRTPAGATYESVAPPLLPGATPRLETYPEPGSAFEVILADHLAA